MIHYDNTLDMIKKINAVHHKLIAHELPLIDQLTTIILRQARPDQIELRQVRDLFVKLFAILPAHLNYEAKHVYPSILRQADDRAPLGQVVEGVQDMLGEHAKILDLFWQLRQATQNYRPDREASAEIRLAYEKLAAIEKAATELIRFEADHAYAEFTA